MKTMDFGSDPSISFSRTSTDTWEMNNEFEDGVHTVTCLRERPGRRADGACLGTQSRATKDPRALQHLTHRGGQGLHLT